MTLDARHHEQQLTAALNDDISALERDCQTYKDQHTQINPDNTTGYKLSDLLNGLIEDNNTLTCFDECLNVIVSEYDSSNILKIEMDEIEILFNKKCSASYQQISNTLIDSNRYTFDVLLRIARKIKAIDLVTSTQKMIHIPHKLEDIQSVIEQLQDVGVGVLNNINMKIKKSKKTKKQKPSDSIDQHIIISDETKEEKKQTGEEDNNISNIELEEKADLSSVHGLTDLILTDHTLYKKTNLFKKRDKKKTHAITFEQIGALGKRKAKQNDIQMTSTDGSKNSPKSPDSPVSPVGQKHKKVGHPVVKCEGCGNEINLNLEYDKCITYSAPIIGQNKLFYFHSSFCVTLRRLKESVRRYVLDDSLAETNRANTTIQYIKNLLINFSTLITIKCIIPKPQFFGGEKKTKRKKKQTLHLMSMMRDNAWKLILKQQALDSRDAKNFEEDYEWEFEDIPRLIQYANMNVYGESLYIFVTQQLQSKQWNALWLLLAFIAAHMNTTKSLQLLNKNGGILCTVKDISHLDVLCTSMIKSADFAVAMALYLSAFMSDAAEKDLSRANDFEEIGDKYIRIANNLVDNVESSHLLALLLETPTDITANKLNVFEIAIKYEINSFMHSSRVQMLMASMWSEFDYLNPNKRLRTTDIDLFSLCRQLIFQPAKFYYCPVGRFWSESVMYICYITLVTIVVYARNYDLSSNLSLLEWIMWIFNAGFVFNEILQFILEGFYEYITDVGNTFDVVIMINWSILFCLRFFCQTFYVTNYELQCSGNHDKNATMIYMMVFCGQVIILWSRTSMIFRRSRSIGPFLTMIPGMIKDVVYWAFVLGIFFIGFCFGVDFIVAGDINPDTQGCDVGGYLTNFSLVTEYIFLLLMGQSDWSYLEPNGCISQRRSLILKLVLWFFALLGTVLLLNLLIAMMASTYERIREGTAKQVNFARAEQTYILAHRNAIIPPPLNAIAFVVSMVWFLFEFILFILSFCNYIINIEMIIPLHINYNNEHADADADDEQQDNKDSKYNDQYKCCGLLQKLNNPKDLIKNYKSTNKYCPFCRCFMRENGNISDYFALFIDYKLDEGDTKFMKSLLQNDNGICPQCFRPYKKYDTTKSSRKYRISIILELVSFYIFMIFLYIPLILLIALPAILNGGISSMDEITNPKNTGSGSKQQRIKKSVFKDEKYMKLIESVIDEETLNNDDLLSLQISALHKKLVNVNTNQINTNDAVEKQSLLINNQIIPTLMSLLPYIKKINNKMDDTMVNTQQLHEKQLDVFMKNEKEITNQQELQRKQHEKEMESLQEQLFQFQENQKQQQITNEKQQNEQNVLYKQLMDEQNKTNQQNQEILYNLQHQIEREEVYRAVEEQQYLEEKEKNDLLSLKKEKELNITHIKMQHVQIIKKLEAEQAEINEKLNENLDKTIRRIETQINKLKKNKNTEANEENKENERVINELQNQLISLSEEQEKIRKNKKTQNEIQELQEIQDEKKLNSLKEQMEIINREKNEFEEIKLKNKRKNEEKNMKYLINMEKLTKSVKTIQFDNPLTALELANVCNLELKEAEALVEAYDVNGDGLLDMDEFQDLRNQILIYQKEYISSDDDTYDETIKKDKKAKKVNYDAFIAERKRLKEEAKQGHKKAVFQRKELLKLNMNQLARKCREANLSSKGTKADLVNRLMQKQKQKKQKNNQNNENYKE